MWAGSAAVIIYAVTTFTVTAGVLVGGEGGGFFAGHMAATICWIASVCISRHNRCSCASLASPSVSL